jgi:hypothetical protein
MAASSLAITTGDVVVLADQIANNPTEVDDNFSLIVTAFNASIETASGHNHDGTNSRSVTAGIGSLSIYETEIARIMGVKML